MILMLSCCVHIHHADRQSRVLTNCTPATRIPSTMHTCIYLYICIGNRDKYRYICDKYASSCAIQKHKTPRNINHIEVGRPRIPHDIQFPKKACTRPSAASFVKRKKCTCSRNVQLHRPGIRIQLWRTKRSATGLLPRTPRALDQQESHHIARSASFSSTNISFQNSRKETYKYSGGNSKHRLLFLRWSSTRSTSSNFPDSSFSQRAFEPWRQILQPTLPKL